MNDFSVVCEPQQGGVLVRVAGELDLATVDRFNAAVDRVPGDARVGVDLSQLSFISSLGVAALLRARKRRGERFALCGSLQPDVAAVLRIVGLEDLLAPVDERRHFANG